VALSEESAANLPVPETILMDQEAFQRSEEFKMNHIQPRVLQDWYANDAHLLNNWLRFAERFRPSHEVNNTITLTFLTVFIFFYTVCTCNNPVSRT